MCLYDRRNVGSSDTVDAVQTPADMQHDMEAVLAAGGVKPPYILMAASFGGLVATQYLTAHPDDVVGMVLIDTMFPDELRLDPFIPREFRFEYYRKDDRCCSVERIAQYDLVKGLQHSIGREPDIPVVYLASQQQPRTDNPFESPKYDARIVDALAAYVDRFSPGILRGWTLRTSWSRSCPTSSRTRCARWPGWRARRPSEGRTTRPLLHNRWSNLWTDGVDLWTEHLTSVDDPGDDGSARNSAR